MPVWGTDDVLLSKPHESLKHKTRTTVSLWLPVVLYLNIKPARYSITYSNGIRAKMRSEDCQFQSL